MNAEQKRAWLAVGTGAVCLILFSILLPFFGGAAGGVFGLFGINGFARWIGRGEKPDERDLAIARRATLIGAIVSYQAFLTGCMGTWAVVFAWHGRTQVDVHVLGIITAVGGILLYLGRSVAILVLYGRKAEADNA